MYAKNELKKLFIKCFLNIQLPLEELLGASFLITGATGLIGSMVIKGLLALNETQHLGITIFALARSEQKAKEMFGKELQSGVIKLIVDDICNEFSVQSNVDFIIHGASITQSNKFIQNPVEVIKTGVIGAGHILEFAKKKNIKSMVFLSSMEVYGFTTDEELLTESNIKYLDPLELRSCYPESKRMVENMCVAYAREYQVPVKIIRLAQTFGYGVQRSDTRVFAEFARCAIYGKDITLLTDGNSKHMYLDTIDAVTAILTVMLKGENGKAYNAANEITYCSILDMAKFVNKNIAHGKNTVKTSVNGSGNKQFPPPHKLCLDITSIKKLGWQAQFDLREMYRHLLMQWGY